MSPARRLHSGTSARPRCARRRSILRDAPSCPSSVCRTCGRNTLVQATHSSISHAVRCASALSKNSHPSPQCRWWFSAERWLVGSLHRAKAFAPHATRERHQRSAFVRLLSARRAPILGGVCVRLDGKHVPYTTPPKLTPRRPLLVVCGARAIRVVCCV